MLQPNSLCSVTVIVSSSVVGPLVEVESVVVGSSVVAVIAGGRQVTYKKAKLILMTTK